MSLPGFDRFALVDLAIARGSMSSARQKYVGYISNHHVSILVASNDHQVLLIVDEHSDTDDRHDSLRSVGLLWRVGALTRC